MMDKLINERSGKVKKYLTTFRKRIAADEITDASDMN